MARHQTGNKSLLGPMMAQVTGIYASLDINIITGKYVLDTIGEYHRLRIKSTKRYNVWDLCVYLILTLQQMKDNEILNKVYQS